MWLLSLVFLTSCSFMFGIKTPEGAKNSGYTVNFKALNWVELKVKDQRSDYVFENKKDGRILLSNSFCKEFQDQPLDLLAINTFNTVDDLKIEKKEFKTFHEREAYQIAGKGSVDGVEVALTLLNTRRNNCYFDFVSITPQKQNSNKESDFEDFLKSVEFK
jgi:hypothetical protein